MVHGRCALCCSWILCLVFCWYEVGSWLGVMCFGSYARGSRSLANAGGVTTFLILAEHEQPIS